LCSVSGRCACSEFSVSTSVMAEGQSSEVDQPPTSPPAVSSGPRSPPVELVPGPRSPPVELVPGPRSPSVELVLSLPDFLDCFPAPHLGRIVSGLDVLTRPECGVAPDAVFTFRRRWTTSNSLYVYMHTSVLVHGDTKTTSYWPLSVRMTLIMDLLSVCRN